MPVRLQSNISAPHTANAIRLVLVPAQESKIIGEALLAGESKILIKPSRKDPNKYYFLNTDGQKLGYVCLENSCANYGPDGSPERNLYVSYIRSYEKGIGSLMHEFAVLLSEQRGFKGRVTLQATNGSHIFHYLAGFRSSSKTHTDDDKSIQLAIEFAENRVKKGTARSKKDYDTSYLGYMHMYLPEDKIIEIVKKGNVTIY
jgi:hypothetical protein